MKHAVTEIELQNGAKGLFINVPGATVMVYDFNFRAGEYLVQRQKWEVPHLLEHVLLGANEDYKKSRLFQAEFEKNGAYTNAHTGTYHISYEAECADFEWRRILELMLVAISKPLFLRDEFRAEFGNVKDERAARTNNYFFHLAATSRQAYGLLAMTDREALRQMRNVRLKDLIDHYQKTHVSSNLRFMVGGDLKGRKEIIKKIIENVELPKGKGRVELPSEQPKPLDKPVFIYRPSVKTMFFYLDTFSLKRFDDQLWDALGLVNTMLTATLNSRILGEARERGLIYSMSSSLDTTLDSSQWWFGAQVIPKNCVALFEIITRELCRVRQGDISIEDLEAAKQYLLGRHQRGTQTVGGTLAGYSGRYYFDNIIEDYHGIPQRIKAITKSNIVESVNQMFIDKIGGLGILGNGRARQESERLYEIIQSLWD